MLAAAMVDMLGAWWAVMLVAKLVELMAEWMGNQVVEQRAGWMAGETVVEMAASLVVRMGSMMAVTKVHGMVVVLVCLWAA